MCVEAAVEIGFGCLGGKNPPHHGARHSVIVLVGLPPCSTSKARTGAPEDSPSTSEKQKKKKKNTPIACHVYLI